MAFDGFVTRCIADELNYNLAGGKIDKVYQPDKRDLIIFVHTKHGGYKLFLSAETNRPGIYITTQEYEYPLTPPSFCMLARKHLIGGRIVNIEQKGWQRIIEITLETRDELGFSVNKKLIIEIMGKHSNITLVDLNSGKIIDAIKRISFDVNRARQILPGVTYQYPPPQEKLSPEEVIEVISVVTKNSTCSADATADNKELLNGDANAILSKIDGISPLLSRELAESHSPCQKLASWLDSIKNCDLDCKIYLNSENTPLDFHTLKIDEYVGLDFIKKESVSETIESFYLSRDVSNRIRQTSSVLIKHTGTLLKKLYLKKQRLCEDILKAQNSEKYRLYGELLTANLHSIKNGADSVSVLNYYDNQMIDIPLDKRYSPSKNAQRYFKKYNKAKTAIIEKNVQLKQTESDIAYLESVVSFLDSAETLSDIANIRQELIESGFLRQRKKDIKKTKQKVTFAPFEYKLSDGHIVMAGKNNKENDALTLKKASKNDIWFHTKDIPGSHTILFTNGTKLSGIDENAIYEAASVAAYHSKARSSENVPVDYTLVKHVKKPSGAKPGMVIFTDNKTVYVNPKVPKSSQ